MIRFKVGDILEAEENIICHQVNTVGIMGGGLARQIAEKYPEVEKIYKEYCKDNICSYDVLGGQSLNVPINEKQKIANCFTQFPNFNTDYGAIIDCFTTLLLICKYSNKTIAVPYGYGSNIANGSWTKILRVFDELSDEYDVPIVVYRLPEQKDLK